MKTYYMLTKPGIIFGNIITMAAGFAMASKGHFNIPLFILTIIGLSLVIASAGIFNNYYDRDADAKMDRTKNRPFVTGKISSTNALLFATLLGFSGAFLLAYFTNYLTLFVALFGFFVYLVLYAFWKYRSFYGTLVGSVAGAVPPVVGYTAVSDRLDTGAALLFTLLVLWQMPHFFAIAIFRMKEYKAASIPVLPVKKGIFVTKVQILLYIIAFSLSALLIRYSGYVSSIYFLIALALCLAWIVLGCVGLFSNNDVRWARRMFIYSLVVIMTLCITIAVDSTFI